VAIELEPCAEASASALPTIAARLASVVAPGVRPISVDGATGVSRLKPVRDGE
jgi:hypothetical protein